MITDTMRNICDIYGTTVIGTVTIDMDYSEAKFEVKFDDGVWYYVKVYMSPVVYDPTTFAPFNAPILEITESNVYGVVGRVCTIRDKSVTSTPSNFGNSVIQWLENIRGI